MKTEELKTKELVAETGAVESGAWKWLVAVYGVLVGAEEKIAVDLFLILLNESTEQILPIELVRASDVLEAYAVGNKVACRVQEKRGDRRWFSYLVLLAM